MNLTIADIKPNKQKAIALLKREVAVFVCDAVQLEGINITLPEVQTLLEGITVGGHKLSDQEITLNQSKSWAQLISDIEKSTFEITAEYAKKLHGLAGKNEALEWGCFRSGMVTIAGTDYMPPKPQKLAPLFDAMVEQLGDLNDIYDRAINCFLMMARNQFFFDVNKRMGRFMMNGILLDAGYPAINVPVKRQLEFNTLMLEYYEFGNSKNMNAFLRSCLNQKYLQVMSE
ncbi:MAG: Fic family protein [Marinagarivorans sp.]|nr:Fic family protein [Marinagarivorans sp.]